MAKAAGRPQGPPRRCAPHDLRALLPRRGDLTEMGRAPRKDLFAGVTVAVAALPLSLGFGVASGLGAEAGLASAVVAGGLAALFGGSRLQITGPTGVMAVVLAPVAHTHGARGVLTTGLIAGILLVVMAVARVSRSMRFVPVPVVKGFIAGSAAVILFQQTPAALGVEKSHGELAAVAADAVVTFTTAPDWTSVALAVTVLAVSLLGPRKYPTIPFSLLAVATAAAVCEALPLRVATIGHLPAGLPAPDIGFLDPALVLAVLPAAVTVAALCAMESLMTAAAADEMSGAGRHDGPRVLLGQGVANLAAPFFGGVAVTGTVCRTGVNVRSGAVSRLAALSNSAVIALVLFAAASLVETIPLAALAGVLIATAARMVDFAALRRLTKADRGQAAIAALTAAVTVAFDLVSAVLAGVALAVLLSLHRVSRSARLERVPLPRDPDKNSAPLRPDPTPPPRTSPESAPTRPIVAYRLHGPLVFVTADRVLEPLARCEASAVILCMDTVTSVDSTGLLALGETAESLGRRGVRVLLCGVRPADRDHLQALGVLDKLRQGTETATFPTPADTLAHVHGQLRPAEATTP